MKTKLIITFLTFSLNAFAQDPLTSDTSKKKTMHISTHGNFTINNDSSGILTAYEARNLTLDSTTLITLSMVDSDSSITKNWDKFIERYKDYNYLILVTTTDDGAKRDFSLYFYKQRAKGLSIKKSYELTVIEFQGKYPNLKHYLNIKN